MVRKTSRDSSHLRLLQEENGEIFTEISPQPDTCQRYSTSNGMSCTRNVTKKTTKLPNGLDIPLLGLGTTHSGGYSHEAVVYALRDCGYRLIDTAKRYGVEEELGYAIKESGVERSELFVTTKLWPLDFGFASTSAACEASCKRLGVDYLDMYLTHFPEVPRWFDKPPRTVREETWRALELLYEKDTCKSIGVSNYGIEELEELLEYCSVRPHANQIEFHPFYNPTELRSFCNDNGIMFTGYCPLGKGRVLSEQPILDVAARCNKTPAQVCIRYCIQNGVPAIPKSIKKERLFENSQVFDFKISDRDMKLLSDLKDWDELKKCVPLVDLQSKFQLPDGYKLLRNSATAPASSTERARISSVNLPLTTRKANSSTNPPTTFFLPAEQQ